MLVRVRVELTTLALSAPRSADWANRPDMLHFRDASVYKKDIQSNG